MESRQFGRNLTSGIFSYHSHKALTNRSLLVNSKQPKTAVMANVYLPVSMPCDTLTKYSFFRLGRPRRTWREAFSLVADIRDGHGRWNMAMHC